MLRLNTILTLSLIIFALPFLGLPQSFDNFFYVVFGAIIFVSALLLKKGAKRSSNNEGRTNTTEGGKTTDIRQ